MTNQDKTRQNVKYHIWVCEKLSTKSILCIALSNILLYLSMCTFVHLVFYKLLKSLNFKSFGLKLSEATTGGVL